jgi:hypothetical protein
MSIFKLRFDTTYEAYKITSTVLESVNVKQILVLNCMETIGSSGRIFIEECTVLVGTDTEFYITEEEYREKLS